MKNSSLARSRRAPALKAVSQPPWAEVWFPGPQLEMPMRIEEIPERVVRAIRQWRGVEGLRQWIALQTRFSSVNAQDKFTWSLESHMRTLGGGQNDLRVCAAAVREVLELTRLEIVVYHPNGEYRLRGQAVGVRSRGPMHPADRELPLEMEFFLHPVFHKGLEDASGQVRPLWAPAPRALLDLDAQRMPAALLLGLVLPSLWQQSSERVVTLSGARLLECAGITLGARAPARVWSELRATLDALVRVGVLGSHAWQPEDAWSLQGSCELRAPNASPLVVLL